MAQPGQTVEAPSARTATKARKPQPSAEAIMAAVVATFSEKGYHGTSIRDITTRAGFSVAAFYQHFDSKYAALVQLIDSSLTRLTSRTSAAVEAAGADPADQLVAAVRTHVLVHAERRERSLIGNSELRSLQEPDLRRVIAARDAYTTMFRTIIDTGIGKGLFRTEDAAAANRAILTMCTAVAQWFDESGPDTAEQVADQYAALALRMLGHAGA